MGVNFGGYLEEGTRKLIEIVSSSDVDEEEKCVIVEAFSNELLDNIGNTSNLQDYEPLLCGVSVRYIDGKISTVLSNENASYGDYENAISLCQRQQTLLGLFQRRKWEYPKVDNTNLDQCVETLRKRQEFISISSKILEEDRQIDELSRDAQADLSVKTCDRVLNLLVELEENVAFCKSKRVSIPAINNKDTKKVRKKITDLRKVAEQKEALYRSIYDVDLSVHSLVSLQKSTPEQWQEIVSLCQRQSDLLCDCNKNGWLLPLVRYTNPNEVTDKYKHYLEMIDLDKLISLEGDSLFSNKQYESFFRNCDKQKNNIEICKRNGWEIPSLNVSDPVGLSNTVHGKKSKRDKAKKIKSRLVLAGMIAVCLLILLLFGIHKYRQGKVQIPFDSSYPIGEDIAGIYNELEKAGFENIIRKQDYLGWQDSGTVIRVSIDNSETYDKGDYQNPDVNVVITYSSAGRVYVTDLLKDWKKTDYETVQKIFKNAGFTNVIIEEVITSEKDKDKRIAALTFNGDTYTNEHCYLPTSASIIISYYVLRIGIGNDSSQFIGQDYETVVDGLKESGFTNIQTQKITTHWAKGNTVVGVTVNNVDTYDSSESFDPDVKIVVKYSSDDRIDATSLLEDWQTKNYERLQNSLKSIGFTNIAVVEKATDDKAKNHLVSSITLNNEVFTAGDCYLQKAAPIKIEYYILTIVIGDTASSFEGKQYSDVVSNLKAKGFANIQLQRANDIGWWPIHAKEGSIKTFSISGSEDFEEKDSFHYDDQIIIIVHTKKDEGCGDITVVAD